MAEHRNFMKEAINDEDLAYSTAGQVTLCLCIDTSRSMEEKGKIKQVNTAVRNFINEQKNNEYAQDCLNICIVTFGGYDTAKIVQPFTNVRRIVFRDFTAQGTTLLASGIDLSLDQIQDQVNKYRAAGTGYYKPWLVIMSDGRTDENLDRQVKRIHDWYSGVNGDKLQCECVGVGDGSETEQLAAISPSGIIDRVDNINAFENFFNLLSQSVTKLTLSTDGENINTGSSIDLGMRRVS